MSQYFSKGLWLTVLSTTVLALLYYLNSFESPKSDSYDLYLKIRTSKLQPQTAKNAISKATTIEDSLLWLDTYIYVQSRIRSDICLPEILEELKLATKIKNEFYIVEALTKLMYFPDDKKQAYLKEIEKISETSKDPIVKALCYTALSEVMYIRENTIGQVYTLMRIMETLTKDAPYAELMIANTQSRLNRTLVDKKVYDQVKVNFFDYKKWPNLIVRHEATMVDYYIATGKYDSARPLLVKFTSSPYHAKHWADYYAKLGKMDSLKIYLEKEINRWDSEIHYVGVPLRELAKIKVSEGELQTAKILLDKLIKEADEKIEYLDEAIGLNLMAEIFLEQHNYDSTLIMLARNKKFAETNGFFEILARTYQIESRYYKLLGERSKELESTIKYVDYKKKADSLTNPLGMQELLLKENYIKQNEILNLLNKEKHNERVVLLVVSLLAIILTTSLYLNIKQRASKIKKIDEFNRKLLEMNSELDTKVKLRTIELENKNQQLINFAFVNAHKLRAPVATILGLMNLYKNNQLTVQEKEGFVDTINELAQKLDSEIRTTQRALE